MNYDGNFILQKSVNRSLLNEGLAIPVPVCSHFHAWDSSILEHGASKPIKILIDGEFYDYRDEISGEKIGDEYGDSIVEAHHIDCFTKSQNNDSTNIIIISPNYHRIIYKNNPHFKRKKYQFESSNGEVLRLKLYEYLKV